MQFGSQFLTGFMVWYLVFLFSTTLHEAMHSFVSHRGGDATAYSSGTATLNPVPHIQRSPFGMLAVPIVTFILSGGNYLIGWASAPFNPYWAARYPKRSFLMSLAGPLSHLPLIVVSFVCMYIGLHNGYFGPLDPETGMYPIAAGAGGGTVSWALAMFLNVAFRLNIILLIFNILPLPPLDGSEVWYLFIKREEDRLRFRYTANSYAFAGLLLAWYFFPRIYTPVAHFLIYRVLYGLPI
ncbi:MAG: site-2 protease family protein [Planctomycetaceae bacterium]|nr:site-2 protease family protein [Planctomycetaceae bacterium]